MSTCFLRLPCHLTDFEKAFHGLQTANGTEVNAILEWTHGDKCAREDAFPVLKQASCCWSHVENICNKSSGSDEIDDGKTQCPPPD